jgi:hypothetical protein
VSSVHAFSLRTGLSAEQQRHPGRHQNSIRVVQTENFISAFLTQCNAMLRPYRLVFNGLGFIFSKALISKAFAPG